METLETQTFGKAEAAQAFRFAQLRLLPQNGRVTDLLQRAIFQVMGEDQNLYREITSAVTEYVASSNSQYQSVEEAASTTLNLAEAARKLMRILQQKGFSQEELDTPPKVKTR